MKYFSPFKRAKRSFYGRGFFRWFFTPRGCEKHWKKTRSVKASFRPCGEKYYFWGTFYSQPTDGMKTIWKKNVLSHVTRTRSEFRRGQEFPSKRFHIRSYSHLHRFADNNSNWRSIMPGILFAGATLVALVGVVLPLFASYFFGGQITLYLSSPYGFQDIPDQTGTLSL